MAGFRFASPLRPWLFGLLVALSVAVPVFAQGTPDFTELVERYANAVVSVSAEPSQVGAQTQSPNLPPIPEDSPLFDYFRHFFGDPQQGPQAPTPLISMGSGFIISEDGYVLTNAHVVEGAGRVMVGLADRRQIPARVVGTDPRTDVALLQMEAKDLNVPVTQIGDSNNLKVGQWVLAIGSPFGLEHTATQGIISALQRSLPSETYVPFIQTDAAVNPGNSGGPLFNLAGEVIGINSQIYSRSGGYMGVSFAIPINVAMEVADQLRKTGRVVRGWLGVQVQEVTPELAPSFGLNRPRGALVGDVLAGSPAAKAGLQVGDVIIRFNGRGVERSGDLPPLVGRTKPGTEAPTVIIRDGKEQTLQVRIEELPEEPVAAAPPQIAPSRLGIQVTDLPPERQRDGQGVLVSAMGPGAAAEAGLQPGDIILRLNNRPVGSAAEFNELVAALPPGQTVPMLILRGGGSMFFSLKVPR